MSFACITQVLSLGRSRHSHRGAASGATPVTQVRSLVRHFCLIGAPRVRFSDLTGLVFSLLIFAYITPPSARLLFALCF